VFTLLLTGKRGSMSNKTSGGVFIAFLQYSVTICLALGNDFALVLNA
jgi:hypothetical protein